MALELQVNRDEEDEVSVGTVESSLTAGSLAFSPSHELAREQSHRFGDTEYLHNKVAPRILPPKVTQQLGMKKFGPWACVTCDAHNYEFNVACECCGQARPFEPGQDVITPYGAGIVADFNPATDLYGVILAWRLGQHESTREQKDRRLRAMIAASSGASLNSASTMATGSTSPSRLKVARAFLHHTALRYPTEVDVVIEKTTARLVPIPGLYENLENLAELLPRSLASTECTLRTVHLSNAGVGDLGAIAIAGALPANRTVSQLNLDGNGIGEDGARALGHGMAENSSVRLVSLAHNPLGNMKYDVRYHRKLFKLKQISVFESSAPERRKVGKIEERVDHERIRKHPDAPRRPPKRAGALYVTYTAGFQIPDWDVNDIVEVQEPNPPHDCRFDKPRFSSAIVDRLHPDRGVLAVLEGLASNRSVEELRLDSCGIHDSILLAAKPLLEANTCLSTLTLTSNYISRGVARETRSALQANWHDPTKETFYVQV